MTAAIHQHSSCALASTSEIASDVAIGGKNTKNVPSNYSLFSLFMENCSNPVSQLKCF